MRLGGLQSPSSSLSAEGWAFYVIAVSAGNIIGHSNVELMPALARSRLVSFLWPPFVVHALHHARRRGNFGFASTSIDWLLGSEIDEWRRIHREVCAGRAMTAYSRELRPARAQDVIHDR